MNFFPVALALKPFLDAWGGRVTYEIRAGQEQEDAFNFCFADVPWREAGSIQTAAVATVSGAALSSAPVTALPVDGYRLPSSLLTGFSGESGLMVCEARSASVSLRLDVKLGDKVLYTYFTPMTILPVKQMYNWFNFRHLSGERRRRETEYHSFEGEDAAKALIFLHGANVAEVDAEVWGDVLFKRLWLSGSKARFYNVDWRSDIGGAANYHQNASNAFVVASQIASTIDAIPGEKVIVAHSLGNMVVSSMIQDYGLRVSKYIMCNSAVPSEAYYPKDDTSIRVPQLVHPDWVEYPTNSWASNWHKLFARDVGDDRRLLGWPGRFKDVAQYAVNFYSTGDEVLELVEDNNVGILTGVTDSFSHHAWHKQELFKGRGVGDGLGATTWSGWNTEERLFGVDKISVEEARNMDRRAPAEFKTNTVFYCYPTSMNSPNIDLLTRAAHLTQGIPALTKATGATVLGPDANVLENVDLNVTEDRLDGNSRPNGWPTRPTWADRWLHSDIKNVSYYYGFKLYEKLVEKGGLR